jgi:putative ATPase
MDLFQHQDQQVIQAVAPLAARMRPRTLAEFVGQAAILGEGRLLRRAIQADQLSSLIFFGPPGTGKTTLAQIIANTTQAHFLAINAVLAGVKEIRDAITTAQEHRSLYRQRTILFVDEVHRFNKAQQDALLPWVENGAVILIGATTENPYFEVNKALVSRSRIFQLKPLQASDLRQIVAQTLADHERGYGQRFVQLDTEALDHLVNVANGDARSLLNALELAVETTPLDEEGGIHITLAVAEESIQQRAVLYDKEGDVHFDTISAFIKSVRGSDPDAALYWLARMVYAGEDPRFIFRRLLILASEDVGLANPTAIATVNACAEAFDRVGMPEGRYALAQATLYLATSPKSNSIMGFFDALAIVEQEQAQEVPLAMRDGNRDRNELGHGAGYLYPHAYRDHWVAQQYLPAVLQGQVFYQPTAQGYEQAIQQQVARHREAQQAAVVDLGITALPENLTFSTPNARVERWLQRTLGQVGEHMGQVRDRLFALTSWSRHHVVLDLNAGSGLLTWEALRQVPEGGVYACVFDPDEAKSLSAQITSLPELSRPVIVSTSREDWSTALANIAENLRFERILGRNVLQHATDPEKLFTTLQQCLGGDGMMLFAETVPRHTQRLYKYLNAEQLGIRLYNKLIKAEEAIYKNTTDPMVNWDIEDLNGLFKAQNWSAQIQLESTAMDVYLTPEHWQRWFAPGQQRPSYGDHLSQSLSTPEITRVRQAFAQHCTHQTVAWQTAIAFIKASPAQQ